MADQGVSEGKAEGKKGGWGNEEKVTILQSCIWRLEILTKYAVHLRVGYH